MLRFVLGCIAVALASSLPVSAREKSTAKAPALFARDNLVAWCIVPFDSKRRRSAERADMLARLGFKRFAYDWRSEHVPTFDVELTELKKHGIQLDAFWFPAGLNKEARAILDALARHKVRTQLWVTMGDPGGKDQQARVEAAARVLRPIALEAGKIGCTLALYNHGGWFGEPENQIAIIEHLKLDNVGIVYNLHHGHHHLERMPALLKKMLPHLWAFNLNGMVKDGDKIGKKILPLGQGDLDLQLLKTVRDSGYKGPIGILGHTSDDAEERLRDNLDGLDWLLPQLQGRAPGPFPKFRTYKGPPPRSAAPTTGKSVPFDAELATKLATAARTEGNVRRGALVFSSPQFACLGCHKVGASGGAVGPELSKIGSCLTPAQIVEAVLWPQHQVKDEYKAIAVITTDGKVIQGYKQNEDAKTLVVRDPASGKLTTVAKDEIDDARDVGSLMPEGLAQAMTPEQLRDVLCFLMELGRTEKIGDLVASHAHTPAHLPLERAPLHPEEWSGWKHPVNYYRVFDFYTRAAEYFRKQPQTPFLLPAYPGLDGPKLGHWGGQSDTTWKDDRWNASDVGSLICGVFRTPGMIVPRGMCVRLGDTGELGACFNPQTFTYDALWQGKFVSFSSFRHGFMEGPKMAGNPLPLPDQKSRHGVYRGLYRHGTRVIFAYTIDGVDYLDAPWAENGKFTRSVAPAARHPLAHLTRGGPAQWPEVLETRGTPGSGSPYAIDSITPPFANPWKSLLFFGGHDFLPDGSAVLCTMEGDVWRAQGLDVTLEKIRWRKIAAGLHQALGLVVSDGQIYVLGRDQITRLHDLNGDGEMDFYECFSNAYTTSTGGHDFICGLQRDGAGNFYTASSIQGLLKISADGKKVDVLATGFRNPDGLGLLQDGSLTVPCSEGDWTPASMVCLVRPDAKKAPLIGGNKPPHFGFGGPRDKRPPDLPLVYLPRGLDNSSGGQVAITSDQWGPLRGLAVHLSYGACTHMLLLRDNVNGQPQGAIVPLPGDFLSGVHRGRFSLKDGQLYVSGMAGWGNYAQADGCFQRVRYTGKPVQLPVAFHVHENGVLLKFSEPVEKSRAEDVKNHFAQAWNYRYSGSYGSPEFSPSHPGVPGHDAVTITRAHLLEDDKQLFVEMPELQPVNVLHLRLHVDSGRGQDIFITVHGLDAPFTALPGYQARKRTIAPHPILADVRTLATALPNPWRNPIPGARVVGIRAEKNLTFAQRTITVKAGEVIKLRFTNPDAMPHNWVLVKPGTLHSVGTLVNQLVADPDAAARQYVPRSPDVLVYTNVVQPQADFTIYFRAPAEKGRYPYLCSFPGHWMVMNGQMIVE